MSLSLSSPFKGCDSIRDYFDSEEGQRHVEKYAAKLEASWDAADRRRVRFHERFQNKIAEIIEKVCLKYAEDSYRMRWYYKGIEPPETWLWFLFNYAEYYGEEVDPKNIAVLDRLTMFTTEAYILEGYLFERLDGQGSVIQVSKL